MRNKARLLGIYLPIFVLTLVSTVTMRCIALFGQFNFKTGYFTDKTLITVSDYILIGAALFFFTYIFTARRDIRLIPDFTSSATYLPTGLVGVALIFGAAGLIKRAVSYANDIAILKQYNTPAANQTIPQYRTYMIFAIAVAIFAVLSAIHFVLMSLIETRASSKRANFGMCSVVLFALYTIYIYFCSSLPLNAPNKTLDEMVYLFAAVFFLYETRLSLGRERWRPYIAFGFIAASIAAYSSIPSIIVYLAKGQITSDSIYELAISFTLFIFITARILTTTNLIEEKESELVLTLAAAAEAREIEVSPPSRVPEVIDIDGESLTEDLYDDDNQLTIDDVEGLDDTDAEVYTESDITETKEPSSDTEDDI